MTRMERAGILASWHLLTDTEDQAQRYSTREIADHAAMTWSSSLKGEEVKVVPLDSGDNSVAIWFDGKRKAVGSDIRNLDDPLVSGHPYVLQSSYDRAENRGTFLRIDEVGRLVFRSISGEYSPKEEFAVNRQDLNFLMDVSADQPSLENIERGRIYAWTLWRDRNIAFTGIYQGRFMGDETGRMIFMGISPPDCKGRQIGVEPNEVASIGLIAEQPSLTPEEQQGSNPSTPETSVGQFSVGNEYQVGHEYQWRIHGSETMYRGTLVGLDDSGWFVFRGDWSNLGLAGGTLSVNPDDMAMRLDLTEADRLASFDIDVQGSTGIVKEAMSRKDLATTVLALAAFLMLPTEIKDHADVETWLARRGGSIETAMSVARALGKTDPKAISVSELRSTFRPSQSPAKPVERPSPPKTSLPAPGASRGIQDAPTGHGKGALQDASYWMGRDSTHSKELNQTTKANAANLFGRVNALLAELGVDQVRVTSGWRPPSYNEELRRKGIPAARNSQHITGQAVDISDKGHAISNAILRDPKILERHGLWMEDPSRTSTWVHFDLGAGRNPHSNKDGTPRKNRIFRP